MPSLLPSCREQQGGAEGHLSQQGRHKAAQIAASWLSLRWGESESRTQLRGVMLLWALVITHWMCCLITYEIRTCRRFSRDWPIDRSPTMHPHRHRVTESHEVDSHVSGTLQSGSLDQATPLQLYTTAPPLEAF